MIYDMYSLTYPLIEVKVLPSSRLFQTICWPTRVEYRYIFKVIIHYA